MKSITKTKIIATIGPGTESEDKITALINAGANVFRINSSHGNKEEHAQRIAKIRAAAKATGQYIAILLDLQGPKIRVGTLINELELKDGDSVALKYGNMQDDMPDDTSIIPVDYAGIVDDVKKDDKLMLDDGKLEFRVVSKTNDTVHAEVVHGGTLKSRKGVNMPGSATSIDALTERDIDYIKFGVEQGVDFFALSFVRAKEDVVKAKNYIRQFGGQIPIIAKIEKPQAVDNLTQILHASDGVMVARGDLGIELSPEKVPIVQKHIINEANIHRKIVIVATQMLESMIEQPMPTRAEASDVANAIIDGADAIMLSGETAVGKYPVEAVSMMRMIAQNVERSNILKTNRYDLEAREIYDLDSQAIVSAAIRMLDEMEISAIVVFTKTGYTAKLFSKTKPKVPVISISDTEEICRRLNLYWGVFPHELESYKDLDLELLEKIDKMLADETFLSAGDKIIITGSIPRLSIGKTNFIRLHQVGSISTFY